MSRRPGSEQRERKVALYPDACAPYASGRPARASRIAGRYETEGKGVSGHSELHGFNFVRKVNRAWAPAAAAAALAGVLVLAWVPSAQAGPSRSLIAVNTTDEAQADGLCALREAVIAANTNQPVDGCAPGGEIDLITIPR